MKVDRKAFALFGAGQEKGVCGSCTGMAAEVMAEGMGWLICLYDILPLIKRPQVVWKTCGRVSVLRHFSTSLHYRKPCLHKPTFPVTIDVQISIQRDPRDSALLRSQEILPVVY